MFKILFVLFLIIAFVAPVRRFLFWLIVGKQIANEQKKYNKKNQPKSRKEGDINVEYVPKDSKNKDFDGGQYVDYEDVNE